MSEYLATFAYSDRLPGSRDYAVGVDVQKDFEHIALLVATISGEQLGRGRGRQGQLRDRALRSVASAVADWAEAQIRGGQPDRLRTDSGLVEVPSSELDAKGDQESGGIALEDGFEILRFTST